MGAIIGWSLRDFPIIEGSKDRNKKTVKIIQLKQVLV